MYTNRYILRTFLALLFLFSSAQTYPQAVEIENLDRSAVYVSGGSITSPPHKTNWGFICVQDNRFISAASKSGQNLWLTNVQDKINYICVTHNDFTYVVTQKNNLSLLNPSGLKLWTSAIDFTPVNEPLADSDRVYITSGTEVSCYSISGLKKWKIQTEKQSSLKMRLLNDSSILVFLEKTDGAKTCAVRISPYGNIIEQIVFQGTVLNSFYTEYGVILAFSDGKIGMCSVDFSKKGIENYMTFSKWVNNRVFCNSNTVSRKVSEKEYALFTPKESVYIINISDGICKLSFSVPELKQNVRPSFDFVDNKFIIFDDTDCAIYGVNGKLIKTYKMPLKNGKYSWNHSLFIDHGILCFFAKDWTINVFKIISTSKENEISKYDVYEEINSTHRRNTFLTNEVYYPKKSSFSDSVYKTVKQGNYGPEEIRITEDLNAVLTARIEEKNTRQTRPREENIIKILYTPSDMERVINLVPELHSIYLQETLLEYLKNENDRTLKAKALDAFCAFPYDPDGEILTEIERIIRTSGKDDYIILKSCTECVYSICRFMGRPALYSKGRKILSSLFYPQYDEKTKSASRAALQKLADLNM